MCSAGCLVPGASDLPGTSPPPHATKTARLIGQAQCRQFVQFCRVGHRSHCSLVSALAPICVKFGKELSSVQPDVVMLTCG